MQLEGVSCRIGNVRPKSPLQSERLLTGTESSQVRSTVHGHVAWTTQNASGNRGDDIRSIKLAEIQPYTLLHPDGRTQMTSVIAMQGEEKAGLKGMKTVR